MVVFVIVLLFHALWLPYFNAHMTMIRPIDVTGTKVIVTSLMALLGMSSSVVNPIINAWKNKHYRQAFKQRILCWHRSVPGGQTVRDDMVDTRSWKCGYTCPCYCSTVFFMYCPIVLTWQMHTDYTVSAHGAIGCFVYSSWCGIQLIRTVIAQWSKAQVSNLLVVRSSQLRSRFCTYIFKHYDHAFSYSISLLIACFMYLCVFWFRIAKQLSISFTLYGV